ncbi:MULTISPECIES: hypothetical protein [Yersiniaceae]|nr:MULTISPECIES: hypothetical protein [Yersiniaceae]CAI2528725.1 Uncharacterised protein [Serratia ficaria]
MDFNLEDFFGAMGSGLGMGFGVASLIPLWFTLIILQSVVRYQAR